MARGSGSADRARGGTRGRAFKKTLNDRESNSESSYHPTSRPKFQESLKNHENAQGKYYDDKRINGNGITSILQVYLYVYYMCTYIMSLPREFCSLKEPVCFRGLENFETFAAIVSGR